MPTPVDIIPGPLVVGMALVTDPPYAPLRLSLVPPCSRSRWPPAWANSAPAGLDSGTGLTRAGGDVDAAPTPAVRVSGKAKDYFTGAALATVAVESDGMEPQLCNATTDSAGDFAFTTVPPGSVFYLSASRTNYRATRGLPVRVEAMPVTADQAVVSVSDARRQYTTLGLPLAAGKAVVFADLLRRNGTPLADVPIADIKLLDATSAPVGLGPYVFGPNGDLVSNATLAVTTDVGGRSRVGFLDVPPGQYTPCR